MLNSLLAGLVVFGCSVSASPLVQSGRTDVEQVLSLPLFPTPLAKTGVPLNQALSELAVQVRGGYVLFGVEIWLLESTEPKVDLNLPAGSTLGAALRQVFRQLPTYTFEVVSEHVIDVYPLERKDDPNDALNLRVDRFEFNREPDWIFHDPEGTIPGLKELLLRRTTGPPLPADGWSEISIGVEPRVKLSLQDVSVRQILNAVSEAEEKYLPPLQPSGWLVTVRPDRTLFTGGQYSWSELIGVSDVWKQEAQARRNSSGSGNAASRTGGPEQ